MEKMVREFRDSGLSGRQFCREQGVSPSMLYRCLRRTASGKNGRGNELVAVELASRKPEVESDCCLTVVLAGGKRIKV
jgi:hypothetical protein